MTITRPFARRLLALALVAATSCTGGADFMGLANRHIDVGGVEALALADQVVLTNKTSSPVFYFLVGREASALVDWIACADPDRCPTIQPGSSISVQRSQINGGSEPEILVFWWHGVNTPAGPRPDSVRRAILDAP